MNRITKALAKSKAAQVRQPPRTPHLTLAEPRSVPEIDGSEGATKIVQSSKAILKRMRVVAAAPDANEADLYRILRTRVLQKLKQNDHRSLAIVSPSPGAGKTLTAVNLATSIAMDLNHTVLLADLDLRRPRVHAYFGLRPKHGISDYLAGNSDLASCLINPGIDRLVLLPGRGTSRTSSEMLTSPRMTKLAKQVRGRYPDRIIVYDLPPLLASDDAISFLPQVDACLMVVREGVSTKGELERSLALLSDTNLLGSVLNDSKERSMNSYYA